MHLPGYYSSGQFAHMAQVSLRTIRFYDKKNILKPSYVNENGARFYTDSDFVRLQQILLLKYLGFSLDEIREMLIEDEDYHFLLNSLTIQKKLIQERIDHLQMIEQAINNTVTTIESHQKIDWSNMLNLIHLTGIEQSLKNQYLNANNISARIRLHKNYSQNQQGWFPWIYEQCHIQNGMKILELGCGNGELWTEHIQASIEHNIPAFPNNVKIILSDISEGMLRDVKRNIGTEYGQFSYNAFDCHQIPYNKESFDLVIANHVLFYCENIAKVCEEIQRVLKTNGIFICSTYGSNHMQEITSLVQQFDKHIVLSGQKLYENFGLENGGEILSPYFDSIEKHLYKDSIDINQAEPLIEYILSCHGNQNHYLIDRYTDFRAFVEQKVYPSFHITKDAGIFICTKQKT